MEFSPTPIDGLIEIQTEIFPDHRGHFLEEFHKDNFELNGIHLDCKQANLSFSKKGVVRGLHLQLPPHEQAKLVRVISGRVLDVVVDLRPDSSTFGQHYKCLLDGEKGNALYVPRGLAHGFAALSDTVFHYMCDNTYSPKSESGVLWNDKDLGIDWEISNPILSEKDLKLPKFRQFEEKAF